MLVYYPFLPLCHVIFSRRSLFLMLHLITGRFQHILQTIKPRSRTAWTHETQLRKTLTVLLPDWYTQAKIARLSHKPGKLKSTASNIVPKLRSCGFTGVLSFPISWVIDICVGEGEFLHPEFRCRPSLLLLSALFARKSDAKVNFEIKHKTHLEIQLQTPTC